MGYKARAKPKKVLVRTRPGSPPGWWPKDRGGKFFWVYIKVADATSWSTVPEPRKDYLCSPGDVENIAAFFAEDYGPEVDEDGNVDPGLGTFQFKVEAP